MMPTKTKPQKIPWYLILIFLLLALGIGTAGYFNYQNQRQLIEKEKEKELLAIADLKVDQIIYWRKDRIRDAETVSDNSMLIQQIRKWLGQEQMTFLKGQINFWMNSLRGKYDYESIFLLDANGTVRLLATYRDVGISPQTKILAQKAIRERRIIINDLYREEKTDHIHLDILIPLVPSNPDALPSGILLFRIDPYLFLYPLIKSWPTPSKTAETVLVRREYNEVVFLNELRHQKDTALTFRLPISKQETPAVMAAIGKEGIVKGIDYRGVEVLAAIRPVPDSPWYLITKIDMDEIEAPIRRQGRIILFATGLVILAAGVSVGLLWRKQVAQFYIKQHENEIERQVLKRRYHYLSKYANEMIILVDQNLNIIEVNDQAVLSYGYTYEEFLQLKPLDLRDPETKPFFDEQFKEVERQEGVVYETVHRRKDGTTFPVEISQRIIEVEGKKYYQAILRDITKRKEAEEEREKLIHELQEALSKVNTLSGLLPICASCKKIRDDKGYWNQIESYITTRSEAEFSHGICPECLKKLYPDFLEDEDKKEV
jgi:two-component system, cell cycle sensor histidine kinase and response regulator CckA